MKSVYMIDEQRAEKLKLPEIASNMPRKLVELFPIGCACYDVPATATEPEDLVLMLANEEFYRTIGYDRESFKQKDNRLFNIVTEDGKALREAIQRAMKHPEQNFAEKISTVDVYGIFHHVICRFNHMKQGNENGVLVMEVFGIENLFHDSPQIYEDLVAHADRLQRLWYVLKGQPGAIAVIDLESGNIVDMNEGMLEELGLTWEEFRQHPMGIAIPVCEEDRARFDAYMQQAGATEKRLDPIEVRLCGKEKGECWYELAFMPHNNAPTGEGYTMLAVWNINHLKELEEDLKVKIEQHNLLKDIYDEHIMEYDAVTDLFKMPKEIMLRKGYSDDTIYITGDEFLMMLHKDDAKYALDMKHAKSSPETDSGIFECRINLRPLDKEPEYEWYRIFFKKVFGADEKLMHILGRMINIQKDKNITEQMEQRIRMDALTMVLSKATVETELRTFFETEPQGSHAVLMIDVDNFKSVNDTFGHMYGDEVLKSVAKGIKQRFRDTDLVGRIGGDEFVVCMKNVKLEAAKKAAADICAVVQRVLQAKEKDVEVTCSVGIAMYPESGREYETLFHRAEYAMYTAKHEGKNRVFYMEQWGPDMDADHLKYHTQRENDIERMIQTDREFLRMSVELLADCKNVSAGMALLLERVTERYGLTAVSVYRYEDERTRLIRTHHWTNDPENALRPIGIIPVSEVQRFLARFDENGRFSVADVHNTENLTEKEVESFSQNKVASFVYAEYDQAASGQGCIMFQSDKPRIWSEGEKHFFSEFTKIFAIFVVLQDKLEMDSVEIDRLKNRDHLTGLMTEEAFANAVLHRVSEGKEGESYFIISSDIMGFSYVNENFGVEAGNRLLIEFARMIKTETPNYIVSRQFSDFFAGFIADTTREKVELLLTKMEARFARLAQKTYPSGGLHLCIGVYEWKNTGLVSLNSALENASIARKRAKNMGTGLIVHYDEQMRRQKTEDREILSTFHKAMAEERILTYLQPKFDMSTGTIIGAEALSRWKHRGVIYPPGRFIDTLERIGYIKELDFYVFETVLKTLSRWREEGLSWMPVSVNFSKRHFDDGGIAKKIIELTNRYRIPQEYLVIELTESVVELQTETVLDEIRQLRNHSFKVSIDDFGSGYSSLNMLLHIPVDEVKVDRTFLEFYDEDEEHVEKHKKFMRILQELLSIGEHQIVCEGVETKEQAEFLTKCGYTVGQGYLVDKPIPIEEFQEKYCKKK